MAQGFKGSYQDWVQSLGGAVGGRGGQGGQNNNDEPKAPPVDPAKDPDRYDPASQITTEAPIKPEIEKPEIVRYSAEEVRDVDLDKILAPEKAPEAGRRVESRSEVREEETPRTTGYTPTSRTVERAPRAERGVQTQERQAAPAPATSAAPAPAPTPTPQASDLTMSGDAALADAETAEAPEAVEAQTYEAETISDDVTLAEAQQGELSPEAIAEVEEATLTERAVAAERDTEAEQAALGTAAEYELSAEAFVDPVTGQTAQVAETPEAEAQQREAITGVPATQGQAAEIIGVVGYEAAQMRTVQGTSAKGAAATMVAEVGQLPEELTATIVEDPQTVEAQIDDQPIEIQAAVAALPTESLVSSQMETLLAGLEDGEILVWARPAVDAINSRLAQRGMSVSTVARDSLFNAIIQSAMPIAQSNAQALQQRAAQNLSNEQQARVQSANLDAQRRLQNTANSQTAASQTAQMAQQMSAMQSQFAQDAMITSAAQAQQVRIKNLQNIQQ